MNQNYVNPYYYTYFNGAQEDRDLSLSVKVENNSSEHTDQSQSLRQRLRSLEAECRYLYMENIQLKNQLKQKDKVVIKIQVFEGNQQGQGSNNQVTKYYKNQRKEPKKRRTVKELIKDFNCPYEGCHKGYASALALNLHMRIKHGGGTKKERKELLKNIIKAEIKGQELPEIKLNLPPNYLEEKKKLIFQCEEFFTPALAKNAPQ